MRSKFGEAITSGWMRSWVLLVLVYFSQAYPFLHVHHSHDEGWLGYEISSHPIEVDVEHSTDHHHDGDYPHTNSHQHQYEKHIDWHFVRYQAPRASVPNGPCLAHSVFLITTEGDSSPLLDLEEPPVTNVYQVSYWLLRGPPQFG